LPRITPDGAVYTTLVNETPSHGSFASTVWLDQSSDGGITWTTTATIASDVPEPPSRFTNTTFRDGIFSTFGAGSTLVAGHYPLYPNPPPYRAANYCANPDVQFYSPPLAPKGHNIRLSAHSWDPQLNAPHTSCASCLTTFIGDYFGIISAGGRLFTTSVSTYNDGSNAAHYQQQVIGIVAIP